jgi:two-component sensor histidine kinase/HAMP domain-containing protein
MSMPGSYGDVIAARLRMNKLWEVVANLDFGETGQAYVVNPSGEIIAHTEPNIVLSHTSLSERPEIEALTVSTSQQWTGTYVNFNGIDVIGVTAPVTRTDWLVFTEITTSEASAVSRAALLLLGLGMTLFGVLVMLVTGRFLGLVILRPMECLQAGARRIGHGDLRHRIEVERRDEVGQVAEAFNDMAEQLSRRETELAARATALGDEIAERRRIELALRRAHDELETRVQERTAELAKANHALQTEITQRQAAEEKLRTYADRLELLREIDLAILEARSTKEIADTTVSRIRESVPCQWVSVVIFEQGTAEGTVLASLIEGETENNEGMYIPLVDLPVSDVVRAGRIDVVEDMMALVDPGPAVSKLRDKGLRSYVGIPLTVQDKLIGCFYIAANKPDAFSAEHLKIVHQVAHSLAVAIQQARLQEELQIHADRVEDSLQEKVLMLQEIHHRVKNNLQIIASLLNLQSDHVADQRALEIFTDSQNRVRSMALIHEKLYRSDNLAQINFGEYIQDLTGHLFRSQRARARGTTLSIEADDLLLGIDKAVPCGLILNELVSNALKHAFPNGQAGEIWIELMTEDCRQVTLLVRDNGVGFPEGLDFRHTTSLGLQLVDTLVNQLDGTIDLDNSHGTEFEITFSGR